MTSLSVISPAVVFFGGGQMGYIEFWMEPQLPKKASDGPQNIAAFPYVAARIVGRDDAVYTWMAAGHRGTDPNVPDYDWPSTVWEEDGGFSVDETWNMPTQEQWDNSYMVWAGHWGVYPYGVTGANPLLDSTMGGAVNLLINWKKVSTPEFFGLPEDTPVAEWPPLEIEFFGSYTTNHTHTGLLTFDSLARFRLLNTRDIGQLSRAEPRWLEISHAPSLVMVESEQVPISYTTNNTGGGSHDIANLEPMGTLRYKWVVDPEDPEDVQAEFLEP